MNVAAVLLAAGRSRRFGEDDKLAAMLGGLPLGLHAARALGEVACDRRFLVRGPAMPPWPGFEIVENREPASGLSRSVALGVAAARAAGAGAVLLALADMPFVPAAHFARLIGRWSGPSSLVATTDGMRRMPPALFGADWFPALEALSGDRGAHHLLDHAETVMADAADLLDVDRIKELDAARRRLNETTRPDMAARATGLAVPGTLRYEDARGAERATDG